MSGRNAKLEPVRCPALKRDGEACGQLTPNDGNGNRWALCPKHASDLAHELGLIAVTTRLTLVAAPQEDSGDLAG